MKRLSKKFGGQKEAAGSPPPPAQAQRPPQAPYPGQPPHPPQGVSPQQPGQWPRQGQDAAPPQQMPAPQQAPPPPPSPQQRAAPPPPQRYPAAGGAEKSLGEIVSEVSEKGALLVREEIELAKAEIVEKAKTLARGAGVGAAAAVFLSFAAIMLLHTLAWFLVDLFDLTIWVGFGIVTLLLIALGVVAGLLARKWLGTGAPTPNMAIQEAKTTRQTLEQQQPYRDPAQQARQAPPWKVG